MAPALPQDGGELFAILAVAPESEIDSAGYYRGVRAAKRRLGELEKSGKRG